MSSTKKWQFRKSRKTREQQALKGNQTCVPIKGGIVVALDGEKLRTEAGPQEEKA
jgi:hypothetical protein